MKIIALICWAVGISVLTKILVGTYNWMKGLKYDYRFEYLRQVDNLSEMEEAWLSVWRTEDIPAQYERQFLEIFLTKIDELLKQ